MHNEVYLKIQSTEIIELWQDIELAVKDFRTNTMTIACVQEAVGKNEHVE